MKVANIIVFDLESGGFLTKEHTHGLCEIAMIAIDANTLEELGRYEAIIAPYKTFSGELTTYTEGALAINGLTMAKIEAGKDPKLVAREIVAFAKEHKIGGRNGAPLLAGHNIRGFDLPYLTQFMEIHAKDLYKSFSRDYIDTLMFTRLMWAEDGSILNHKLGTACSKAGVELEDAHRAMADTEANAELLKVFLKNMRGSGGPMQSDELVTDDRKYREKFTF